jgi:hypothetical protein
MTRVAGIIVRKGRGYVPTEALIEGGPYVLVEPVHTVRLNAHEIVQALGEVIAAGHPEFPSPTQGEWQKREDPVLKAAGVNSWNELAQGGASYTIEWSEDSVVLCMSRLDSKGRFETDPAKTRTFPENTSLALIVEAILNDIRSRPGYRRSMMVSRQAEQATYTAGMQTNANPRSRYG